MQQAAQQVGRKKAGESGWDDQVGEDEQHARDTHGRGDHEGEGAVEDHIPKKHAPSSRSSLLRMEGHIDERAPNSKVHEADAGVKRRERADFLRRNGKDGADQQLLDVLGALRRAVERDARRARRTPRTRCR